MMAELHLVVAGFKVLHLFGEARGRIYTLPHSVRFWYKPRGRGSCSHSEVFPFLYARGGTLVETGL